jgi:hypothetical protein
MVIEEQPKDINVVNLVNASFTSKINKRKITISWLLLVTCCDIYWYSNILKKKIMDKTIAKEI